eukprot:TRINITY_DN5605_c0_g1_i2.p1 TRINITY_DN5605_c0_g1~~TRINITY_DN5605_c0_g1_i2.p1  ORF type:complete len:191 (-),score=32.61 TRINITY_DN5605_c0_g1_i2:60-632(-)
MLRSLVGSEMCIRDRSDKVTWIKGDAMNPSTFQDALKESQAVIHTVGTLIDTSLTQECDPGEPGTYEQMNRDTAIAIGNKLEEINKNQKIVYISASRAPPFLKRYLTTKLEAEEHLRNLKNVRFTALRPGFIYSKKERVWSVSVQLLMSTWQFGFGSIYNLVPERTYLKELMANFDVDTPIDLELSLIHI